MFTRRILMTGLLAFAAMVPLAQQSLADGASRSPISSQTAATHDQRVPSACYDQITGFPVTGVAISSQKAVSPYSTRGADDFTLTSTCVVESVDVLGAFFAGGNYNYNRVRIRFYHDSGTAIPGALAPTRFELNPVPGSPNFHVSFPSAPITLTPGTWWISVRVRMNVSQGQWGWMTTTPQTGYQAVWKNPGNGFGTGCQSWTPLLNCFSAMGMGQDFMFSINDTP